MSKEEFKARRDGMTEEEAKQEQDKIASDIPARDFIMNRSKELVQVPISGPDGVITIEIRARLTRAEIKAHRKFLEMFAKPEDIDEDEAEIVTAKFLSSITTDEELDEEFWLSDEIDQNIAQELVVAFIKKAAETLDYVKKFR